ncbi:unnamed protein product, partial [Rotaria sp. Silwood1]
LNTSTITKFEHLPNELILICFDYFDFYWLYELFFDLNQRLNELILYQAKIYINLNSIRHGKFLAFCLKLNQLIIKRFCSKLISSKMKLLKYLHLNFEPYSCGCEHGLQSRDDYVNLKFEEFLRNEKSLSNMETIIIGYIPEDDNTETTTKLSFNTLLKNLLPYLPKLKNLIINSIDFNDNYRQQYQLIQT